MATDISVRQLSSGWWHIRRGSAWCQLPSWPCSDVAAIREHTFEAEWRERFVRDVAELAMQADEAGRRA